MRSKSKPIKNFIDPQWRKRPAFTRAMLALIICAALIFALAPIFSQAQQPGETTAGAPQTNPQERDINAMFYYYELLDLDLKEAARAARTTGRAALQLKGRKYELELEENNLLAPGFRAVITTDQGEIDENPTEVNTYRGRVAGEDDSDVRLLIQDDLMSGYIRAKDEWLFLDPLSNYKRGARPEQVIAYRDADVRPETRGACGVEGLEKQAEKLFEDSRSSEANAVSPTQAAAAAVTFSPRVVEVATDADYEFFQANGANSNTVIRGVINQVDGIYQRDLLLALRITFQNVYTDTAYHNPYHYPYTSTNVDTLLDSFTNFWNANRTTIRRDVAHLFTGKDLDGNRMGKGWIGKVCNAPSLAYSLSSTFRLVAHEIGHNLGAEHDAPSLCSIWNGPIMCAELPIYSAPFSAASINAIRTHVNNNGSCLAVGGVWVGISNGVSSFSTDAWGVQDTSTSMRTFTGDFNGDLKTDVLKIDYSTNCTGDAWVGLSDGNRFNFSRWGTNWCTSSSMKILTGDFTGDGKTDVVLIPASGDCNGQIWIAYSNGVNGFISSNWGTWCLPTNGKYYTGDFNGDGKTDVLRIDTGYAPDFGGGLYVYLSTGNWFSLALWDVWYTPSSIKVLTGDFNRDGKTDVMKFDQSDNCNGGLWVGLSNGVNAFSTTRWATWCTPASIKVFAGDFNGDGYTDVMKVDQSDNGNGGLWVGISNGADAFNGATRWATWWTPASIKVLTGDFNGDGYTDIMKFDQDNNCNGGLWVATSNGADGFNGAVRFATWCTPAQIQVLAGDFNGDGKSDVLKFDVP